MDRYIIVKLCLLLGCLYLFSSCGSSKRLVYFKKGLNESDTISVAQPYVSKINNGDILSIYVNSLNPSATEFFNPYNGNSSQASGNSGINSTVAPGFLVNEKGTIELPLIGSVKVVGLTTSDARDTIKQRLKYYLKEPIVTVRVLNYKISVLGEVGKPNVYTIPNENVTLPEVITMAGDLTSLGSHDNIMVIREVDGKKQFGHVNLNDRSVFKSPYYYLHSNDMVYVEPIAAKNLQNSNFFRIVPLVASVATLMLVIITRVF
ncbi:polysaccharide biosynthesis/export family protein [Mucilaginibacter lacusdianchii]|uniref:polysaccharide biosynthesis/export family protein n=1 Tax=Mucilaginibacter lacusdianchii TaxID=2684211 RepID=UPI00131CB29A|nr:polysaccharide biosynthesis/export family protein [Mucilaginibacter sp. JXJ CY 39]